MDGVNLFSFEAYKCRQTGRLNGIQHISCDEDVVTAYKKAVAKGMLKVMAKMGISTLQSYKGAQIFEIVGLATEVVDLAFRGTASRVEGVGMKVLAEEMEQRHSLGYPKNNIIPINSLPNPGDFHWRRNGDAHMWDPFSVSALQEAARDNNEQAYWQFSKKVNEETSVDTSIYSIEDMAQLILILKMVIPDAG